MTPYEPEGWADLGPEAELVARWGDEPIELEDPPEGLWESIAARLHDEGGRAAADAAVTTPTPGSTDARPRRTPETSGLDELSRRRQRRPRRSTRVRWISVGIAAAIVALAVVGGLALGRQAITSSTVASADLTPVTASNPAAPTGSAKLVRKDGQLRLIVVIDKMPPPPDHDFYELWLIDADNTVTKSLAQMHGSVASHVDVDIPIPAGVDTATLKVVDISIQPDAGGPAHSGDSLLRGTLA